MNKYIFFIALLCWGILNISNLSAGCLDNDIESRNIEIISCSYVDLYAMGSVFMKGYDKSLEVFYANEFEKMNIAFKKNQFLGALIVGYETLKENEMSFLSEEDKVDDKKRITTFHPTLNTNVCQSMEKETVIVFDMYRNCCEGKSYPSCWFGIQTLVLK